MGQEFTGEANGDFRCAIGFSSRFTNVHSAGSKWNAADLHSGTFIGCSFSRCDFTQANLNACLIQDCTFVDCTLDLATFASAKLERTTFLGGRAEYASFWNASLDDVTLDTQLHGADLRWKHAKSVDMGSSNLWGASINASCSQFRGVTYSPRQLQLFLGLLSRSKGAATQELRSRIGVMMTEDAHAMIDRLMLEEEG